MVFAFVILTIGFLFKDSENKQFSIMLVVSIYDAIASVYETDTSEGNLLMKRYVLIIKGGWSNILINSNNIITI